MAAFSDTAYGLVSLACIVGGLWLFVAICYSLGWIEVKTVNSLLSRFKRCGRTKTNARTASAQSNESVVSSFDEDDASTKVLATDHTEGIQPHLGDIPFNLSSPRLLRMSTERIYTSPQLPQTGRVIRSQTSSRDAGTVSHMETPPSDPSPYTPSDALSFTTIVSTIPPSYRTRRSEELPRSPTLPPYSSGGVRPPQTPPSSFVLGGRDSSRPRGPRTASTHARSLSRSRIRVQDLQEDAGQSRSARCGDDLAGRSARDVSQNGKSGNHPMNLFIQESESGKPRKSIDGGVRLAGGPPGQLHEREFPISVTAPLRQELGRS
ncbi:hypothetical protein C8Q74DRAFT_984598 [Fomes fomentarius]|nr:hypothetical protein C8Q74DRAFT_984598 [Fomes fomentarius]